MRCDEILGFPEVPIKVPSPAQLKRFNRTKKQQDGPILDDLHLDFESGGLASHWNKRAAALFANDFVMCSESSRKDKKVVEAAFKVHLKALRLRYLKQVHEEEEASDPEYDLEVERQRTLKARENRRRSVCLCHRHL